MDNRIAELRHEKSLTLKELGNRISMRDNTLSQYETGKRQPKMETWQKLADFFNVPVAYLQGSGWSASKVIKFLLFMITNRYNDNLLLPSDHYAFRGKVAKYGLEKETLDELDNEDLPNFNKLALEHISNYMSFDEFENVDEFEIPELTDKYLNQSEIDDIRNEIIDGIENDEINIVALLEKAINKELIDGLCHQLLSAKTWLEYQDYKSKKDNGNDMLTQDFDNIENQFGRNVEDFNTFEQYFDQNTVEKFKKTCMNKFTFLSDFVFLSTIGASEWSAGITPEYEIANKLKENIFNDEFSENPYASINKKIQSLNISLSDKKLLIDTFNRLIQKNNANNYSDK